MKGRIIIQEGMNLTLRLYHVELQKVACGINQAER